MSNNKLSIIPTAELLSEMQALEVHGGEGTVPITPTNAFLSKCTIHIYTGNCVVQCGCGSGKGD